MKRIEGSGIEALGLIWVICSRPEVDRELKKTLSVIGANVHEGQEPPSGETPYSIVLCPEGEEVASEVMRLRDIGVTAPVLVFGSCGDPPLARAALKAGASGFVNTYAPPEHFFEALSLVSRGEIVLSREILVDLLGDDLFLKMPQLLGDTGHFSGPWAH
jgi:DNA-binding NarL/FixJ family response regulator